MKQRVIIVHGWMGKPDGDWIPWIKEELENRGAEVVVPRLSHPLHPQLSVWLSEIQQVIGVPDEQTYFIGHSLGCMTVLRYFEQLDTPQQIGGAVLVAAFATQPFGLFRSFFRQPLEWEKVKQQCRQFVVIHSDNDKVVSIAQSDIFQEALNAQSVIVNNKGHMTGWDKVFQFPQLLEIVAKMVIRDQK